MARTSPWRAATGSRPARQARLLGTSGSFVFVWWPDARVAEAIPIETVQGLVSRIEPKPVAPRPAPAIPPASRPASVATAGASSASGQAEPAR
jgi:hypothetical protein